VAIGIVVGAARFGACVAAPLRRYKVSFGYEVVARDCDTALQLRYRRGQRLIDEFRFPLKVPEIV
jgi:hypothetical protein